jgi:putative addiction module killer protein
MQNNGTREIIIYATDNGKEPFSDWLDGLDKDFATKVFRRLLRILNGNLGDYKSFGNRLYELRFHEGLRVYFSQIDDVVILLLAGGDKNTKRDQSRDIEKSREYLNDYEERRNERKI